MLYQPAVFGSGAALVPAGGGGVTSITFSASTISSAISADITGHSGIIAGDILIHVDFPENTSGTPTTVVPSGFTQVANINNAAGRRVLVSYKKATGAEASATITGMVGDLNVNKILAVFRPNIAATTVTLGDPHSEYTAGVPADQTVLASAGTPPLIIFGAYATQTPPLDPRTFTVGGSSAKDGEVDGSSAANPLWLAYKIYNSSPADAVVDMDDEGQNFLISGYLAVA